MNYFFEKDSYNKESKIITLHGPCVREAVTVTSNATGASKPYEYDFVATTEENNNNEGWDGEQYLSIFNNTETGVTLRVWETPYDEWEL
jgi:hypothetical protein